MTRIFLIICLPFFLSAQEADSFRYKRANNYYQAGKYKLAAPISRNLYQKYTDNIKYFRLYRDILLRLKRNTDAINIIKFRLLKHPSETRLKNDLASLYFDMDQKKLAYKTWNDLLKQKLLASQYSEISNKMLNHRLFERAISVYKLAQKKLNNKSIFSTSIAQVYEYSSNYEKAFLSYLDYLRINNRNLSYVRQQILAMLNKPDAKEPILKKIVVLNEKNESELQLKIDLLISSKQYLSAFNLLRNNKKNEHLLFNLALDLVKLNKNKLAEKIFKVIIKFNSKQQNAAIVGLLKSKIARSKQALGKERDSIFIDIDQCVSLYHKNSSNYNFDLGYAIHLLDQRNNLDKAELYLSTVLSSPQLNHGLRNEINFQLGRISFFRQDFKKSNSIFKKVSDAFKDGKKFLYLNTIALLKGESSNRYLNALLQSSKGLKNTNLNDALNILIDISHFAKTKMTKKLYAKAMFYFLTSQVGKCLSVVDSLEKILPEFILSGERFKFKLYLQYYRFDSALLLAEKNVLGKNKDEWMLRIAKIYFIQRKNSLARKTLEECILKFPNHFWTIEARRLLQEMDPV